MNPGPLRRLVGMIGLVSLLPIAWQLFAGGLEPTGAAVRALAVLAVVVVVGRVVSRYLDSIARSVVRDLADDRREVAPIVVEPEPES